MEREFELIALLYDLKSALETINSQLNSINDTLNSMVSEQLENSNTMVVELSRIADATESVADEFQKVLKKES